MNLRGDRLLPKGRGDAANGARKFKDGYSTPPPPEVKASGQQVLLLL